MNPRFTRELALARFAIATGTEFCAVGICFLPLLSGEDAWKADCRRIGLFALFAAFGFVAAGIAILGLFPRKRHERRALQLLEALLSGVYIFNVVILALITARTGGATASPYGTLIPIQLSAVLFMQLEKDRLTGDSSVGLSSIYVSIALLGYLFGHYGGAYVYAMPMFTRDSNAVSYAKTNASFAAWLTVGAMVLSYFTYAIPASKKFGEFVENWFGVDD
jgi:hypothetical protein